RADRRHDQLDTPGRNLRAQEDCLESEPLRNEAVERRQRRDRHASYKEREGGQRHAMDEAAEMFHIALAGRRQYGAGTEEQQALEDTVIEDMEQRRSHGDGCSRPHVMRREGKSEAKTDENDADILHSVVGKQALEVVLHQRAQHAEYTCDAGKRDDGDAPPPSRRTAEVENDADEA